MLVTKSFIRTPTNLPCRLLSTTTQNLKHYKLVIVGGGSSGTCMVNKFAGRLGQDNVAIIEGSETHYYQPSWTLVGAGIKTKASTVGKTADYIPSKAVWINEMAGEFRPSENKVITASGKEVTYDNLVVALGVQLRFDMIKGLNAAFDTPGVCSNYSYDTVGKTWEAFQKFDGGNAIFTFPNTPIKCAGAPQKAAYLFDAHLRKNNKREGAKIMYNTALPAIFGISKYAEALNKVVADRDIELNTRTVLTEVKPETKEAIFDIYDADNKVVDTKSFKYDLLHVGPPCTTPKVLRNAPKDFVDAGGFLDVDQHTLQHKNFDNVFGIGDCINAPVAKTCAAISTQSSVLRHNIQAHIAGKPLTYKYNGYASCPLTTGKGRAIMAEFGYNGPLETFPINQAKEWFIMGALKYYFMAPLYWNGLIKGWWEGPTIMRKIMHGGRGE